MAFVQAVARVARVHLATAAKASFQFIRRTAIALSRFFWRVSRAAAIYLINRSPLSEPRRSAGRSLLKLIPWVVVAIFWTALTLAALVAYYAAVLPDPRVAGILKQPPNMTIVARRGEFIAERGMRRAYVPYAEIPPNLVKAVISTEDRRFFYHFGFDPIGITRAMAANSRSSDVVQGGSTITQQLVKNLFLSPKRTLGRKCEEIILALWLESRFTKKEILELYLNRVYFGSGNYGIGAAAHYYFGKEPKDLTQAEAALLAGLIKAPSYYSPSANIDRARARAKTILHTLAETDQIDINQYAEALANPATLKVAPAAPGFGHVADWVAEVAPMLTGEIDRNLIVETTIDADLQKTARSAVEAAMRTKGRTARANEAAFLLMTPDGAIRAMIGGRNHAESQFNRAVHAKRQPGSAFKPFIYLAAMEAGYTSDSMIDDSQVDINGWKPENFGKTYRGKITLRSALTHSSNMAAVRLLASVGGDRVVETARRLGVYSVRNVGPTLALGTSETTLLEMTSAFAVFANGGMAVVPEIVERIRDDKGNILFERQTERRSRIVSARAVSAMNDMMNSVVAGGTAQNASMPLYPAAGKTGTSQRFKDAWFVGYTAQWVGGVWLGNDNATPMRGMTGGSLPAEIWKSVMTEAHQGILPRPLPGTGFDADFDGKIPQALGLDSLPALSKARQAEKAKIAILSELPSSKQAVFQRRAERKEKGSS